MALDRDPPVRHVGVRELSRRTTWVLGRVEAGEQVVVSRRRCPIAVILSAAAVEDFLILHAPQMLELREGTRAERIDGGSLALAETDPYEVRFSTEAARAFSELGRSDRGRIGGELRRLAQRVPQWRSTGTAPPAPSSSFGIELRSAADGEVAIVRAGNLRVVCVLDDGARLVHVLQIVSRTELRRAALGLRGMLMHTQRARPVDWND
jgi:prevent-host-death family protein